MSHAPDVLLCTGQGDGLFRPRNDIQSLTNIENRNLVVAEEIQWIHTLSNLIIGAKVNLIPVVHAAKEETPQKPPKMKYKDLPIYQSPHYEYKDYVADQTKCPNGDVKLLQEMLYPKVQSVRITLGSKFYDLTNELILMKNEICAELCKQACSFKCYMRSKENLAIRQAVVAAGALTGVYIGSGTRGIVKKLLFGTIGALATGALCFPEETDEAVRNTCYTIAQNVIMVYNMSCNKKYKMREPLPCKDDLPPPLAPLPKDQMNLQCQKK